MVKSTTRPIRTQDFHPIRIVRLEKGYTVARGAQLSGISSSCLSKIETKKTIPRPVTAHRILKALGLDASTKNINAYFCGCLKRYGVRPFHSDPRRVGRRRKAV